VTATPEAGKKDPLIGRKFGDYKLTSVLATGGMARIYRGMDENLNREAAVKVHVAADVSGPDSTLTQRFQREAKSVAVLDHENIIPIYQFGIQDSVYFLAMKLVKGHDLSWEMRRLKKAGEKMYPALALGILDQVAHALDYAHQHNVVHRDVKPSNILLSDNGRVILTDFGLVLSPAIDATLGTAFGTPRYIAPEQAVSSHKALPQSDIYSLATIFYEILSGDTPFTGDSPMEIALSQINDDPPPIRSRNPDVPAAVEKEIMRALAKEPHDRHQTALEFVNAVRDAYGLMPGDLMPITPLAPIATDGAPGNPTNGHIATARVDRAVTPRPPKPVVQSAGSNRLAVIGLVAVLLLGMVAVGFLLVSSTGNNGLPGAPVVLYYNDKEFTMHNTGDYRLNLTRLRFVRGVPGTNDDYNGDRVAGDVLPAGFCARIVDQSEQQVPILPQCTDEQSKEVLNNVLRYFWRREEAGGTEHTSYEVWYDDRLITRCETVTMGESKECRFEWPVPPG
jgi:tRNA A-37 threonylcarbamoyl transferase component Bud32